MTRYSLLSHRILPSSSSPKSSEYVFPRYLVSGRGHAVDDALLNAEGNVAGGPAGSGNVVKRGDGALQAVGLALVFPISDYAPFEYAVVTAGGVSCEDVNRYTMESLKVKGLYFAGEVWITITLIFSAP